MITKLNKIQNVGKFNNIVCNREFSNNNIIFGFNGAGKSTLSDIFYSLSKNNMDDLILRRRTLPLSETEPIKQIYIEVSCDNGSYKFKNDTWDKHIENMFVYNNQYINDYVFVNKEFSGDAIPIGMSKEGVALMNKKNELQKQLKQCLSEINALIKVMKPQFSNVKEIGGSTITMRGIRKRCQTIANFKLYNLSQEPELKKQIKNGSQFCIENNLINQCKEKYNNGNIRIDSISISNLEKILLKVPRIYRKELIQYIGKYLNKVQVKWILNGYYNQKDKKHCPFCGQEIVDTEAISFFKELAAFSNQKSMERAQEITNDCKNQVEMISRLNINMSIQYFNQIIEKLNSAGLLLNGEVSSFSIVLQWTDKHNQIIDEISEKIYNKIENPFSKFSLNADEKECLQLLNKIAYDTHKLINLINTVSERLDKKINKMENSIKLSALYEISFGDNRESVEKMIENAKKIITNISLIDNIEIRLDDLFNSIKVNEVNKLRRSRIA